MGVSIDLLTQFAKTIKAETKEDKTSTIWGTAVKLEDGSMGVRYDGAEIVTPASPTTNVNEGERVLVTIKNHYAYISNNITDPSASSKSLQGVEQTLSDRMSFEYLEAYEAIFDSLEAKTADIDNVEAIKAEIEELRATYAELDYVSAKDIEALNIEADNLSAKIAELDHVSSIVIESVIADIHELKAKNASFTCVSAELLKAVKADINQLNTDKLSAKDAEIQYANIDFSNIKMAAVEELFTKAGIIEYLTVGDVTSTGEWIGVTIKGDLIEANTLKADRLLIQGEDGLYYKLNVNSLGETTASSDDKYQNGLDGSVIIAESITANKIRVEDLVAFDATIGGFHITDSSLYSNVKESIDNTTKGIYMDSNGQFSVGDSKNYLKFYEDTDGNYIFETSYMKSTDDGLVIGNLAEATLRGNVLIDDDSVDIRIGDKVLASYEGKNIYLGKNSADAVIDLCDGTGIISNSDLYGDEMRCLDISSNGIASIYGLYGGIVSSVRSAIIDNADVSHSAHLSVLSRDETMYTILSDFYYKREYVDSTVLITDVAQQIYIRGDDNDPSIKITSTVNYEDYTGEASIFISGSERYNGTSRIRLSAGEVDIIGTTISNSNRILLASKGDTSYYGMITPEGNTAGWIRTTSSGIIPYSQDSTNGTSSLGSSSWPFANAYVKKLYTKNVNDTITLDTDGDIVIPNGRGYHGKTTGGSTRSLIYMSGSNHTVVGYGSYTNGDGNTHIYGKAVKIYSKTANADFKPYYEKGDSTSSTWWTSGFITNSSKNFEFTIFLSRPVIGSPAVTVTSDSGLYLRQNGKYICGGSFSSPVKPTSYTAELTTDGGAVRITCVLPNATDVVNNETCSVSADIKITFS